MTDPIPPASTFHDLDLPAPLLAALDEVGYETPSPIQAQAIPHLLKGLDLLGHAPTGTGKTAAFALPLLSRLDIAAKHVQVMTLTPTRELAIQVAGEVRAMARHAGIEALEIYGGVAYGPQIDGLERGVQFVAGTPGRILDHLNAGRMNLSKLKVLIFD